MQLITLKSAKIRPIMLPVKYRDKICCRSPKRAPNTAKSPTGRAPITDQITEHKTQVQKSRPKSAGPKAPVLNAAIDIFGERNIVSGDNLEVSTLVLRNSLHTPYLCPKFASNSVDEIFQFFMAAKSGCRYFSFLRLQFVSLQFFRHLDHLKRKLARDAGHRYQI